MSKRMDRLNGSLGSEQVTGRESRGGFWASLRSALGCRGGEKTSMETLEGRQLLSGITQSSDFAMMEWGGGTIEARRGSYLVEFDGYVGKQQAEMLAREVATRLGVDVVDTRAFGMGRFASLQVGGSINAFDALALVGQVPHFKRVEPAAERHAFLRAVRDAERGAADPGDRRRPGHVGRGHPGAERLGHLDRHA
jgi:hypothetical protein